MLSKFCSPLLVVCQIRWISSASSNSLMLFVVPFCGKRGTWNKRQYKRWINWITNKFFLVLSLRPFSLFATDRVIPNWNSLPFQGACANACLCGTLQNRLETPFQTICYCPKCRFQTFLSTGGEKNKTHNSVYWLWSISWPRLKKELEADDMVCNFLFAAFMISR